MNDPSGAAQFGVATILLVLALPAICLAMIWFGMLVDIVMTKREIWIAAGHDRAFNLLLLIGLGPIGAIIYAVGVRPHLARMELKRDMHRARQTQWVSEAA